jgi:hypothetical protein
VIRGCGVLVPGIVFGQRIGGKLIGWTYGVTGGVG